jgi:ADP-ribose pyrophosphatase YjhB (NUDIX family)
MGREETPGHCFRCGARLPSARPCTCTACGYEVYLNAKPTASIVVLDGDRFLALRRVREPGAGAWDLPGGFCEAWEHPTDAAIREAREELAVEIRLDRFIGMYLGGYEYQGEQLPILDCFWLASIVDGEMVVDAEEATEHAWFPLTDPPEMAFTTHEQALREASAILGAARAAR